MEPESGHSEVERQQLGAVMHGYVYVMRERGELQRRYGVRVVRELYEEWPLVV